jgi:phage shock protein PspC (stress-responsive transcriptional regulator)
VLGVCEGIGEDLGFNPVYLRVAFAAGIFFAPLAVIGAYFALGVVVAASRWAFPVIDAAPASPVVVEAEADEDYRIAA